MTELICPICSKSFVKTGRNQKYCCFDCGFEANRRKNREKYQKRNQPKTIETLKSWCFESD